MPPPGRVAMVFCHSLNECNGNGECWSRGYDLEEYCKCDKGFDGDSCEESTPTLPPMYDRDTVAEEFARVQEKMKERIALERTGQILSTTTEKSVFNENNKGVKNSDNSGEIGTRAHFDVVAVAEVCVAIGGIISTIVACYKVCKGIIGCFKKESVKAEEEGYSSLENPCYEE